MKLRTRNLIRLRQDNLPKKEEVLSKDGLTVKERKVLDFIKAFFREQDKAPTIREIGKALGHESTGHTQFFLKQLKTKGFIQTPRLQKWRGISLLEKALDHHSGEHNHP